MLRRLSRAEDTAFCGRVFIFLFQSFPLGDKSSVNLRGEYHIENVTSFDILPPKEVDIEKMDVDPPAKETTSKESLDVPTKKPEESGSTKGVTFTKPEVKPEESMTADELYPVFWSLQQNFSQPKRLFDKETFSGFRSAVQATMVMFRAVQSESRERPIKAADDSKRGTKRKRGDDDLANAFNPKYLTSRDLFELEVCLY